MVSLTTCIIAGIHYLIHPQKLGTITATIHPDAILPVTLLTTEEIFDENLEWTLANFNAMDDVFVPEFGFVLVEKASSNDTASSRLLPPNFSDTVYQLDTTQLLSDLTELPSGPYILHGPNLYQAWRLYGDQFEAFTTGVIPEDVNAPGQFRALNALSPNGLTKSIPVPSRLYHPLPTPEKPLSRLRLAISDAIPVRGIETTLSSRAWTSLYGSGASTTGKYVQHLLDLGAVVVGKTKDSPFGTGEEWVDTPSPWNPRGDGYQDAAGSSAGAAVALAAYEWLDHAVGRHTFGLQRDSTARNGVYSIQLSHADYLTSDLQAPSAKLSAIEVLSRSVDELHHFTENALVADSSDATAAEAIVFLDDLNPNASKGQRRLTDELIAIVENSLGVKARRINLEAEWSAHPPEDGKGKLLQDYLGEAPFRSFCRDFSLAYSHFRQAYEQTFSHKAFVEAAVQFKWDLGRSITDEEHSSLQKKIDTFKNWFSDRVFDINQKTIVIVPYDNPEPHYRHEPKSPSSHSYGVTSESLASLLGTPQFVVPFSQTPYKSSVSGLTENLPVSASIIGPGGSENMLVALYEKALRLAQWPLRVNTGRQIFSASTTFVKQQPT